MDHTFWAERWQKGQTPFHQPEGNPHLIKQAQRLAAAPSRVLVPLCGKTPDLAWLSAQGHEVWGVEFIEQAARAFFEEQGVAATALTVGPHPAFRGGGVTILVADAVTLDRAAPGKFNAIYDRAALVALPPDARRPYLQTLRALCTDDARLLLISFDHDTGTGPPFSLPRELLAPLMDGLFSLEPLDDVEILDQEPRFRERGATYMREQVWLGRPI